MKVIGFDFNKIAAHKADSLDKPNISTNIEFTNVEKERLELFKEAEAMKVSFKYFLSYENSEEKPEEKNGEVVFEGRIILSVSKDESKNMIKSWKKKKLPDSVKVPLFNLILRKCTPKALFLQDEIGLPSHLPIPRIAPKKE